MTQKDYDQIQKMVENAVKVTVNGKIDDLRGEVAEYKKAHEEDMKTLKPIIEGIQGGKILGVLVRYCGGISLAYLAVRALFIHGTTTFSLW